MSDLRDLVVRVDDGRTLAEVAGEIAPLLKKVQGIDLRSYSGAAKKEAKETIRWVADTLKEVQRTCVDLNAASQIGRLWE